MKVSTTVAVVATTLVPFAAKAGENKDLGIEGRFVGENIFASMDSTGSGSINAGDIETFRDSAFAGKD